jgi:hypothetical protein
MKAWMFKLVAVVNSAVGKGRQQLVSWHAEGLTPDKEALSAYLQIAMADYEPEINGSAILTHEDREHLTMALAGILISVMDAETKEKE